MIIKQTWPEVRENHDSQLTFETPCACCSEPLVNDSPNPTMFHPIIRWDNWDKKTSIHLHPYCASEPVKGQTTSPLCQ
jgi:hypothetical protein